MRTVETHTVTNLTARIRIQEYGPLVFKTLPTRSSLKKAIKKGLVLIDDIKAETSDWMENGQVLKVLQEEQPSKIFKLKLKVHIEDEHIAVIEKPSGFPTSGNYFKTIANALVYNLKPSAAIDALAIPQPAHRLDNPTSGLLLVAKSKSAQVHLNKQFEEKVIQKTYVAIVSGHTPDTFVFKNRIEGKVAESVLSSQRQFKRDNIVYSLVELHPKTGRTHQLRIHLSEGLFPIVGDMQYGKQTEHLRELMLHASGLEFKHPKSGKLLKVFSKLPQRFEKFLNLS